MLSSGFFWCCLLILANFISAYANDEINVFHTEYVYLIMGIIFSTFFKLPKNCINTNIINKKSIIYLNILFGILSPCVIIYLIKHANTDFFSYINNINYYRLGINKDQGVLKFALNMWMICSTILFIVHRSRSSFFTFLLSGLSNVFFGYRFAFIFGIFSLFLVKYSHKQIKPWTIFCILAGYIIFAIFTAWRNFQYVEYNFYNSFFNYLQCEKLINVVLHHGFFGYFNVFSVFSIVKDYSRENPNYHYGIDYFLEILRLIKLNLVVKNFVPVGTSVNAFANQMSVADYLSLDAGGVTLGLPGSLLLAGGKIGIFLGSLLWACICRISCFCGLKRNNAVNITFFPYILCIFQSVETNLPRVIIMYTILLIGSKISLCLFNSQKKI